MNRTAFEIVEMAETVGGSWFPSVKQVDELLHELYVLRKAGHEVSELIDQALDYRLVRSLEEKYEMSRKWRR